MNCDVFVASDVREKWDELTDRLTTSDLVILNGDILNLFPPLNRPLEGSIVYEITPDETQDAIKDFIAYKQGVSDGRYFKNYIEEMFFGGKYHKKLINIVGRRLEEGFSKLKRVNSRIAILPGNLDFPQIVHKYCTKFGLEYLDNGYKIEVGNKVIRGIGGIPIISNPVNGAFKMFPYEKTNKHYLEEFISKCQSDLLITHLGVNFFIKNQYAKTLRKVFLNGNASTIILASDDSPQTFEESMNNKRIIGPGSFYENLTGVNIRI